MIHSILEEQRDAIDHFFDHIDKDHIENIIQALLNCKGNVIVTGVGKSGIIANKLAMSLLSTGTKALYLPPLDALHGDIGIVSKNDVCILLSKSGYTQELVSLIPYMKNKGAFLISITSDEQSPLHEKGDIAIELPFKKEICPFNLAPTISTAVQLLFGDIITVALMKRKNFTIDEYATNHPSGTIGKQIVLKVSDLMLTKEEIPLCSPEAFLGDVLSTLSSKRCGCVLVVDDKESLLGIFTDGDLRRAIETFGGDFLKRKVIDSMSIHPKTIEKEALAYQALKSMEEDSNKLITVLPVLEKKKVVGILRMHDILQSGLKS